MFNTAIACHGGAPPPTPQLSDAAEPLFVLFTSPQKEQTARDRDLARNAVQPTFFDQFNRDAR